MKQFILLKLQYKVSFIVFLSLAPSALISWPGRVTPKNPSSSLATSILVPSLTSGHMLCGIQQVIIVESTLSTDSSSLSSRYATSLLTVQMRDQERPLHMQMVSWVSNYKWLILHTTNPTQREMQNIAVSIAVSRELIRSTRES